MLRILWMVLVLFALNFIADQSKRIADTMDRIERIESVRGQP